MKLHSNYIPLLEIVKDLNNQLALKEINFEVVYKIN